MRKAALSHIHNLAQNMRKAALKMALKAEKKGAHLGGALSAIEILACLYGSVMYIDPKKPEMSERDFFIPSKAHCVLAYYTALAHSGFFPVTELETFEQNASELSGHPVMNIKKGIEFSGGSLGMGLSQGVGICLGLKQQKKKNFVFVLLGDGECDEGSIWEAAMSAANFQLQNLIVIVDKNKLQYDGETEQVMQLGNLAAKFQSFGFQVTEADGHDLCALYDILNEMKQTANGKPKVLIANTVKGKGVSFMENVPQWHHSILSQQQYDLAMQELEAGSV